MSKWKAIGFALALFVAMIWLVNSSWIAPTPRGKPVFIAHRGVAQQFDHRGIDNETCTATRIRKPSHPYIENTLPSMRRALELGADGVELDVHPTSDGKMVVFHDWTLDCRTDGEGVTRERTLAQLKRLDVGHGYTADGGKTFPLRGRGVGAMPTVEEVLGAFPRTPLVFNFKSRDPRDADQLLAAFARAGRTVSDRHSFYGDPAITARLQARVPGASVYGKRQMKTCLIEYTAIGWTGHVPTSCQRTTVAIPHNLRHAIWGWPNRFVERMASVGTKVIWFGDFGDNTGAGIARTDQLAAIPRDFPGIVWIEDIHALAPALAALDARRARR